jgi:hypothetical protein
MGLTEIERKLLKNGGAVPRYLSINGWCLISGLGRTTTYKLAGDGKLRVIKVGGKSLVDVPHGLEYLESLPLASIRIPHRRDHGGPPSETSAA